MRKIEMVYLTKTNEKGYWAKHKGDVICSPENKEFLEMNKSCDFDEVCKEISIDSTLFTLFSKVKNVEEGYVYKHEGEEKRLTYQELILPDDAELFARFYNYLWIFKSGNFDNETVELFLYTPGHHQMTAIKVDSPSDLVLWYQTLYYFNGYDGWYESEFGLNTLKKFDPRWAQALKNIKYKIDY